MIGIVTLFFVKLKSIIQKLGLISVIKDGSTQTDDGSYASCMSFLFLDASKREEAFDRFVKACPPWYRKEPGLKDDISEYSKFKNAWANSGYEKRSNKEKLWDVDTLDVSAPREALAAWKVLHPKKIIEVPRNPEVSLEYLAITPPDPLDPYLTDTLKSALKLRSSGSGRMFNRIQRCGDLHDADIHRGSRSEFSSSSNSFVGLSNSHSDSSFIPSICESMEFQWILHFFENLNKQCPVSLLGSILFFCIQVIRHPCFPFYFYIFCSDLKIFAYHFYFCGVYHNWQ